MPRIEGALDRSAIASLVGLSASDSIGFYGVTPVSQRSGSAQDSVTTTAATSTSPYGFSTAAQADGIVTLLNECRATLAALGLMKGSA